MSGYGLLMSASHKPFDAPLKCYFHFRSKLYVYADIDSRYKSHPLDSNSSPSGAMVEKIA